MKVRNDFVTNSSSSSFVIAYKRMPESDQDVLERYPWLNCYKEFVEKIFSVDNPYTDTDEGTTINTIEELNAFFVSYYGYYDDNTVDDVFSHDDEGLYELYRTMVDYVERGYNILHKNVDQSDKSYIGIITTLAKDNDQFVILDEER